MTSYKLSVIQSILFSVSAFLISLLIENRVFWIHLLNAKIIRILRFCVLFYSNEHEPIHVHGKYQGMESKAETIFVDGVLEKIVVSEIKGKKPLDLKSLKNLRFS